MRYGIIRAASLFVFSFFLSMICFQSISHAANIEGRVFNEAGPMTGARVYVYKNYADIRDNAAFLTSEASDEQGRYKLHIPEGEYYLTAKRSTEGKEYFSYLGSNPITVGTGNIWITFLANKVKQPSYSTGATSVKGVVTYKGKPVKGAIIAFYTLENKKFKGLGSKTESVNEDGTFDFGLPPDKYTIIARKINKTNEFGPLENGDLYCYYPGNPIELKSNMIAGIEIPCYPKNDRTSFVDSPMIKENSYITLENLHSTYKFGIKGRVADGKGKAVKGIYVLAYKVDPANTPALATTFKGTHETENVVKTDAKGNYFIPLDSDGTYAVMARYRLGGGTPKPTEIYGFYGNTNRKGVQFKKGQIIDRINITVVPHLNQFETYDGKIR